MERAWRLLEERFEWFSQFFFRDWPARGDAIRRGERKAQVSVVRFQG